MTERVIIQAEDFTKNEMGGTIYGITLAKFLMNYDRVCGFSDRVKDGKIKDISDDPTNENCEICSRRSDGKLCRRHTSIKRVLESTEVCYDTVTGLYFVNNEIFHYFKEDRTLMVIYCPHPVLIKDDELTIKKVRAIQKILVKCDFDNFDNWGTVYKFSSDEFLDKYIKCWFNSRWTVNVQPPFEQRNDSKSMQFTFSLNATNGRSTE